VIERAIFVSYSQPDRECAFQLVAQLEADGLGVWIAPRDISPAADWAEEIIEAIAAARIMVLVFSSHCNDSPQVRREVERAVHRQVPVLPMRIEAVLPARSLEYFLSTQHWLDAFPPPREPYYARLSTHIASLLNATTGTRAAFVPQPIPADTKTPFDAAALGLLEAKLAYHVGPMARLLVKRASGKASNREDLIRLLAAEVDSTAARQQFIDACR
jgi:TIR domain